MIDEYLTTQIFKINNIKAYLSRIIMFWGKALHGCTENLLTTYSLCCLHIKSETFI